MNGPSQRFCLTEINLRQSLLPSPANWTLASNLAVIDFSAAAGTKCIST
jgi:hypothetical protein